MAVYTFTHVAIYLPVLEDVAYWAGLVGLFIQTQARRGEIYLIGPARSYDFHIYIYC